MAAWGFSFAAGRGLAMARAAEAMLRALGGVEVQLRIPCLTSGDDPRLGLANCTTEDLAFAPVVARPIARDDRRAEYEFLFPATAVSRQVEDRQSASVEQLFTNALGVVFDGKLLRVTQFQTDSHAGVPFLFRVTACE